MDKRDSKSKPKADNRPKRSLQDLGVPKDAEVKGGGQDIVITKEQDKSSPRLYG